MVETSREALVEKGEKSYALMGSHRSIYLDYGNPLSMDVRCN